MPLSNYLGFDDNGYIMTPNKDLYQNNSFENPKEVLHSIKEDELIINDTECPVSKMALLNKIKISRTQPI